jgi:hypothetical protein
LVKVKNRRKRKEEKLKKQKRIKKRKKIIMIGTNDEKYLQKFKKYFS